MKSFTLLIFAIFAKHISAYEDGEIEDLTKTFFDNLQQNVFGIKHNPDAFIDRQIVKYVTLIKRTQNGNVQGNRRKRATTNDYGITRDDYDIYTLSGLSPLKRIDFKNPRDVVFFNHCYENNEHWYAVSLENDNLVIRKYNGSNFVTVKSKSVNNGIKLGVHTTIKGTFIAAAENATKGDSFAEKSSVYFFNFNEELEVVQKFDVNFASDVTIWEINGDIFMAVAKQSTESTGSVIYKYYDGHFDIIQNVESFNAIKVMPFFIGKEQFLIVVNQQREASLVTYSEIFKYDLESEKFNSYQKIFTEGVSDIKVFCFSKDGKKEYFLAVANTFSKDVYGNVAYNTSSTIYKFVEDNFIPFQNFKLNGATEWLPVIGGYGKFALFAASKFNGLKIFHYNGWKFIESPTQYTNEAFAKGITAMNSYVINGHPVVVVANENDNGNMMNYFALNFKKYNAYNSFYNEMLDWCQSCLQEVQSLQTSNKTKRSVSTDKLQRLEAQIAAQTGNVNSIELFLQSVSNPAQVHEIPGDVFARNILIEQSIGFNNLIAKNVNGVDVAEFLRSVININDNIFIKHLDLAKAEFVGEFNIGEINGVKTTDMRRIEDINLDGKNVVVNGTVTFNNGLRVNGTVSNVTFADNKIVLKSGDQKLTGSLNAKDVNVGTVNVKFLNKLNLNNIGKQEKTIFIEKVKNLTVNELFVKGYLNNIDVETIDKYSLRKIGDQVITANYTFNTLEVNGATAMAVNDNSVTDDLIRTDNGTFIINGPVKFTKNFTALNVTVTGQLNEIIVIDKKFDVLLKNITEEQEISGNKYFANLRLTQPLKLHGKIRNNTMDRLKRLIEIEEEIDIFGDVYMDGDVVVEDLIEGKDVTTRNGEYSLKKLMKEGLRINEEVVPLHLKFSQQIDVQNIFADKINDIDPQIWVVNGLNEPQYIKGSKLFKNNLHITEGTNLVTLNLINVPELAANVLTIDGNQVIRGKHHIQNLTAENIQGENINISDHPWRDIIQSEANVTLAGTTTFPSLEVNRIICDNVNVININSVNFDDMIKDTVVPTKDKVIGGHKHFETLYVNDLTAKSSIDLDKIPTLMRNREVHFIPRNIYDIPENVSIEKIFFRNKLNHLTALEFSGNWLEDGASISGDQYFGNLILEGNNYIVSNYLNSVNLTELRDESLKIDEDYELGKVEFRREIISAKSVQLDGQFEDLDMDNVAIIKDDELKIMNKITFTENVFVSGNVYVSGMVNSINFTHLCEFAEPKDQEEPKNLIVAGNGLFVKGPLIKNINRRNITEIEENTWYRNKEQNIQGMVTFKDVYFEEDITVQGYVDEVNLQLLKETYFSKSKNQTITSKITFNDDVTFRKNIYAPTANVGTISGIKPEKFSVDVILDGYDQVFEEVLFVENLVIDDLQGDYSVNDLNLRNDFMRYDGINIITEKKTFRNIKANKLKMDRDYKVQNVQLLSWIHSAARKTGSCTLNGRTSFKNVTIFNNGIGLEGLLNRNHFTVKNVMLKSLPQEIVGNKTFLNSENASAFKTVKLRGLMNGRDVAEIMNNQVFKNGDVTFETRVDIASNIIAQNVQFDELYEGVNVTGLLQNLSNYATLNNYYNNYIELYRVAEEVRNSLSVKARYLNYYKAIQDFGHMDDVFGVQYFYEGVDLVVLSRVNEIQAINFFKWSPEAGKFMPNEDLMAFSTSHFITKLAPIQFAQESYLYLEYEIDGLPEGNTRRGDVMQKLNKTALSIIASIPNNGTKYIIPFSMPKSEKSCLLFMYYIEHYMHIYCEESDEGETEKLQLYQRLDLFNPISVDMILIEDVIYITALSGLNGNIEATVIIWKLDVNTELFNENQKIHVMNPQSISCVSHNGRYYLAIASGYLKNTLHSGQVDIKKFDPKTSQFNEWQALSVTAPIDIKFAALPSDELFLYVLCNKPTEPLIVYKYSGISKFTLKTVALTLHSSETIDRFNMDNEHFLITKADDYFTIIKAVFKG